MVLRSGPATRHRSAVGRTGKRMDAPSTTQSVSEFLASVEILSALTRDELERLAEHAEARFFAFGETVCNAGDAADGLWIIKSGSVRIFTEERGKEVSMGVRK